MADYSNEILVLLDKDLRRMGTIAPKSDHNGFWGETFKRQIADDSSSNDSISGLDTFNRTDPNANSKMWGDEMSGLTMLKSSPMASNLVIGNSIARYNRDNGKWNIYRIITTDESMNESTGNHIVTAEATNLAIWRLGKNIPAKKELKQADLQTVMEWLLAGSGWSLENNTTTGLRTDISFDGTSSSQSFLQTVLTSYDVEVQTYVKFDEQSGIISDLVMELVDHVGSDIPDKAVRYGKNLTSIHRNTVDTTLITKMYVYGADGVSIDSVNNGRNFITDAQANAMYNSDANTWLEGAITSSSIKQPSALLEWATRQLRLYNHPRINYTVTTSPDFNPNLGDTVKVVDTEMKPELTVQARVIQKQESLSTTSANTVTLGEFSTVKVVTPSFIKNMQSEYSNEARKLFEKAREDSNASTISLITPQGRSWYSDETSKKCIARLFIDGVNVTSYLTPQSFNWQYIRNDGSHDYDWENKHKNDGYVVNVEPDFVGTLLCSINDEHTAKTGEIYIDNTQPLKRLWKTHYNKTVWGDEMYGAIQCANYMEDGNVIASYSYKGNQSTYKKEKKNVNDTLFIRFNQNGDLMDSMVLHGGGHGSSFTYNEQDQLIYTVCKDIDGDNSWYIGAMPYRPNEEAWVNSFTWRCKAGKFLRPSFEFDNKTQYMMGYNMDGTIMVCRLDDLKAGNFVPVIQCKLQDFGVNPSGVKGSVDGTTNTMQAGALHYPYAFYTMGDVNNKDPRQILCINLITQSKVFMYHLDEFSNVNLDIPTAKGGHFEPEGIYYNKDNQSLVIGLNISEYTDETATKIKPVSSLYTMPINFRVDEDSSGNQYPTDDQDIQTTDDSVKVVENDTDDDSGYDISDTDDSVVSDLSDPNYITQNM